MLTRLVVTIFVNDQIRFTPVVVLIFSNAQVRHAHLVSDTTVLICAGCWDGFVGCQSASRCGERKILRGGIVPCFRATLSGQGKASIAIFQFVLHSSVVILWVLGRVKARLPCRDQDQELKTV